MPADIESMGAEDLSALFAPVKLAETRYSRRTASASYSDTEALYLKPAALASLAAPRDRDLSAGEFWSLFNEMTFELSCAESSAEGLVREASAPLTMFEAWTFLDAQRYQPALPDMPEAFEPGETWELSSAPSADVPPAAMPYTTLLAGYRPGADRNLGMGLLALWQRQSGLSGPQVARAVTRFAGLSVPAPARGPEGVAATSAEPEISRKRQDTPRGPRALDRLPNPPDQDDLDVELSWTTGERDLRPLRNGMFELIEPAPGGGEKSRRLSPEAAVRMIREESFAPDFTPGELTRAQARYAEAVEALDLGAAEARAASEREALRLQTAERYAERASERAGKAEGAELSAALAKVAAGLREGSIDPDGTAASRIGGKGPIAADELAELAAAALASVPQEASDGGENAGEGSPSEMREKPAEPAVEGPAQEASTEQAGAAPAAAGMEPEPQLKPEPQPQHEPEPQLESEPQTAAQSDPETEPVPGPDSAAWEGADFPDYDDIPPLSAYEGMAEAYGDAAEDYYGGYYEEMDSINAAIAEELGGYASAAAEAGRAMGPEREGASAAGAAFAGQAEQGAAPRRETGTRPETAAHVEPEPAPQDEPEPQAQAADRANPETRAGSELGRKPAPQRAYSAQVDAGGGVRRASAAEAAARSVEELAASIAAGAAPGSGKKAATERQLETIARGLRSGAIAPEAAGLAEMMASGGERDAASELIHDHAPALGIKTREDKAATAKPRAGAGDAASAEAARAAREGGREQRSGRNRAAASSDPEVEAVVETLDAWSELAKNVRQTDDGKDLATTAMLYRAARAVEEGRVGLDDPLLAAILESHGQWDATRTLLDERHADIGVKEYGPRRGREREAWKAAGKERAERRAARIDERLASRDAPDGATAAPPDAAADCVTLTLPPTLGIDAKNDPIPPVAIGDDRKTGERRAKVTIPPGTVAPGGRDISAALLYVDVSAVAEMPDGSLEVDLSASRPVTLYLAGGGKAELSAADLAQAAEGSRRAMPQEAGRAHGRARAEARIAAASREPEGAAPRARRGDWPSQGGPGQAQGGETPSRASAAKPKAASAAGDDAQALRALLEEVSEKYSALESGYARMASELERVSARLAALEGAGGGPKQLKVNAIGRGKAWKPDSVVLSGKGPNPQAAKAATPSSDKRRGASRPHSGDSRRNKNRKA